MTPLRFKVDNHRGHGSERFGKIHDTSPTRTFTFTMEVSEDHITEVHESAQYVATECVLAFRRWRDEQREEIRR